MADKIMSRIRGIGAIIIGLILTLGLALPELKTMMAPGQEIYAININEIKEGDHIVGELDYVLDYYAMESTSKTTMGITTSVNDDTARWYAVPVLGESEDDPKIVTVKVFPSGYHYMDKIVENTWAYINGESDTYGGETYQIDARVVKLQYDLYPLYYEWYGTDYREEAEQLLVPYALVPVEDGEYVSIVGGGGILIFIYGLFQLFIKKNKKSRKVSITSAAAYDNYNPEDISRPNYKPESYRPQTFEPEAFDPDERYRRDE